ncbi:B3 domain-containing transcription factor ABI3-like isoform X2 [Rutidosis leptorrhynchoides]|uniref:B3 domain-containing transcription factor ABI3-like isoform X2 n=1 Tax=Rutidosis leptorrhynchoides TaxID=125765 RepID=UPI003A9956E4
MYPKQEKVDMMEVYAYIDEQENRQSTSLDALGTTMMTSTDNQKGIFKEIDVKPQQQILLPELNDPSFFYKDQFPQIPDFRRMSSSSSNPTPTKPISSAQSWAVLKSEYVTKEEDAPFVLTTAAGVEHGGIQMPRPLEMTKDEVALVVSTIAAVFEHGGVQMSCPLDMTKEEGAPFVSTMAAGIEHSGIQMPRPLDMTKEEGAPVVSTTDAGFEQGGVQKPRPLEMTDGSGTIDCMNLIEGNEMGDPCSIFEHDSQKLQQEQGGGGVAIGIGNQSEVVQESEMNEEGDGGRLDELGTMFSDWLKSNKEVISIKDMSNIKLKKSTVECASKTFGSSKEGKKQLLRLILELVQQHQLQKKNSGCGELLTSAATGVNMTQILNQTQIPNETQNHIQHYQGLPLQPHDPHQVTMVGSPTKEERKQRMASQWQTYFNHHSMMVDNDCSGKSYRGSWPSPPSTTTVPPPPMERSSSIPSQSGDRLTKQNSFDKCQGVKSWKDLKFLFRKILRNTDVGSLGRIVLPNKEAESNLPDLDSGDGISIAMEDVGTSQMWNMRYRFWENNKTRMYFLENTGDFVIANGLQVGDFIVLYSDIKRGKYLIRGVKIRQQARDENEVKRSGKRSYWGTS